jgi:osmotically-inducible protein OsmY
LDGTSYPAGPTGFGIQQDIIDELAFEPSIDAAHIGVSVEDGIATLSGHVSTWTAWSVPGVATVENHIRIN